MKAVLTVTKGTRRHVFLLSAFKATLVSWEDAPLLQSEIEDIVKRTWTGTATSKLDYDNLMESIASAQARDKGLVARWQTAYAATMRHAGYRLIKPVNAAGSTKYYTAFQVQAANLTLVRSETIPAASAPQPFESCDGYFINEATGGTVKSTTCGKYDRDPKPGQKGFRGEIDTASTFVLTKTLGKTGANTSAAGLNQTSWEWLQANDHTIDAVVLSRGYILGVDPQAVVIRITTSEAAVSILQPILAVLPVVLAAVVWIMVRLTTTDHYQASLFSNLIATTTHTEDVDDCHKPGYMRAPPEIVLEESGGHVYMKTEKGVFETQRAVIEQGPEHEKGTEPWPYGQVS